MLIQSIIVSSFVAGAAFAADAPAKGDFTGTWVSTFEGRDGQTRTNEVALWQEDAKLTGKTSGFRGGEGTEISDGKVDGNKVSFKVTRQFQEREFTMNYNGALGTDGAIKGTMSGGSGDRTFEREWLVKRKAADAVGKWSWSMEREDGDPWETALTITKVGDKLAGKMGREDAGFSFDLQDVKLTGDLLTYKTVFSRDGNELVIQSKAVIDGKAMKGRSYGSRDGEEWARDWKAEKE